MRSRPFALRPLCLFTVAIPAFLTLTVLAAASHASPTIGISIRGVPDQHSIEVGNGDEFEITVFAEVPDGFIGVEFILEVPPGLSVIYWTRAAGPNIHLGDPFAGIQIGWPSCQTERADVIHLRLRNDGLTEDATLNLGPWFSSDDAAYAACLPRETLNFTTIIPFVVIPADPGGEPPSDLLVLPSEVVQIQPLGQVAPYALVLRNLSNAPVGFETRIEDTGFGTEWLSVAPDADTLAGEGERDLTLSFDSRLLSLGTIGARLVIDQLGSAASLEVPVSIQVVEATPYPELIAPYFDLAAKNCNLSAVSGQIFDVYVYAHLGSHPMIASDFVLTVPDGVVQLNESYPSNSYIIGSLTTGIGVGFDDCQYGPTVLLVQGTFQIVGEVVNGQFEIHRHPGEISLRILDCANPYINYPMQGGYASLNGPCELGGTVSTKETTWGAIKQLYKGSGP